MATSWDVRRWEVEQHTQGHAAGTKMVITTFKYAFTNSLLGTWYMPAVLRTSGGKMSSADIGFKTCALPLYDDGCERWL